MERLSSRAVLERLGECGTSGLAVLGDSVRRRFYVRGSGGGAVNQGAGSGCCARVNVTETKRRLLLPSSSAWKTSWRFPLLVHAGEVLERHFQSVAILL
jgi:hypothetical protein